MDRHEEGLGRYPYVSLAQVKSYLSINSDTHDGTLANIISYATGVVEHYIGQQVLANNYTEVFDGGQTSVFINRLPLSNVFEVTEFDGIQHQTLEDPTTVGMPNVQDTDELTLTFNNDAHLNSRIKRFGKSSLQVASADFVEGTVPTQVKFEEGDFTVEMFIRVNGASLPEQEIFSINGDASNHLKFSCNGTSGLKIVGTIGGSAATVKGANTLIQAQQFARREFAHVAASFNSTSQQMFLSYNGNNIVTTGGDSYAVSNNSFTANVLIGKDFVGFIDEVRISDKARYSGDFTPPDQRFRPDQDTVTLIHFDGKNGATEAKDIHAAINEYSFSRDSGEVTRDTGDLGITGNYPTVSRSYPALTMGGPPKFQPYPSGVKVVYRAGYESTEVPYDLQVATLDMVKLFHKQDQEKKGFSFEGERSDKYALAGNFPPHIRRILDLYRLII
tara:strand:- start:2204 stop:3541 length:1338 start_codon:yes stop_codon:yes gene_type:complete